MDRPAPADHPLTDLVSRRWSPRAFRPEPVSPEDVAGLLEAARWAPSSFNEQPWAFLVAPRDQEEDFHRILKCLVDVNQVWAQEAGLLMIACARTRFSRNEKKNRHALYDLGGAVAQLSLEAVSRGLFVHQMAGFDRERTREQHGIPEEWRPVTALAIGAYGDPEMLPEVYAERETAERTRHPQESFVHRGTWSSET